MKLQIKKVEELLRILDENVAARKRTNEATDNFVKQVLQYTEAIYQYLDRDLRPQIHDMEERLRELERILNVDIRAGEVEQNRVN